MKICEHWRGAATLSTFLQKHRPFNNFLALLIAAVFLLTGCWQAPQQGEPGGQAPVVITIWHSWQGAAADALQAQAQNINQNNPQIIVKLKFVPEQGFADLAYQAEAGGEGPQIFLARRETIYQLYQRGTISPVRQNEADAFPATAAEFRFNGKLYAQPVLTDVPVLYFRQDMVTAPANLAQMAAGGGFTASALDTATFSALWSSAGGSLWNGQSPQLDAPVNLAFLRQVLGWQQAKQLTVGSNSLSLFANGQVPYAVAWAGQSEMLTQLKVQWASVPITNLVGGQDRVMLGPSWALANSAVKTTAQTAPFIMLVEKALVTPDVERALAKSAMGVPAAASFYKSPGTAQGIWADVNGTLNKAWVLEGSAPERKLIPLQDAAWAAAIGGAAAPDQALAKAQSDAVKALAQPSP